MSCCLPGLEISNLAHYPEGLIRDPLLPLPLSIVAATVSGVVKVILFPLTTLLCAFGFAIKACYEAIKGREWGKYAQASLLNFVGFAAFVGFLGASAFLLPYSLVCGILLTAVTVSIIYHVIKAL